MRYSVRVMVPRSKDSPITLGELRRMTGRSQTELAAELGMTQGQLSEFERRADHRISTVRRYAEALGGELQLVVRIDGKSVTLRSE